MLFLTKLIPLLSLAFLPSCDQSEALNSAKSVFNATFKKECFAFMDDK